MENSNALEAPKQELNAENLFKDYLKDHATTEQFVRCLDFDETEIVLLWASSVARMRPLTDEEKRLRRLVYAQHCVLFMKKEDTLERARRTNAERVAAGLGPICLCETPKVYSRGQAGSSECAVDFYCLSCGESLG